MKSGLGELVTLSLTVIIKCSYLKIKVSINVQLNISMQTALWGTVVIAEGNRDPDSCCLHRSANRQAQVLGHRIIFIIRASVT